MCTSLQNYFIENTYTQQNHLIHYHIIKNAYKQATLSLYHKHVQTTNQYCTGLQKLQVYKCIQTYKIILLITHTNKQDYHYITNTYKQQINIVLDYKNCKSTNGYKQKKHIIENTYKQAT